jgi:glycogen operon protein
MKQYTIDREDKGVYPAGLTKVRGGIHVSVEAAADRCSLILSEAKASEEASEPIRIPFPPEGRIGNVWEMTLLGRDFDRYAYAFEADGVTFADPCGRSFIGREVWGDLKAAKEPLRTPIRQKSFDWEGDRPLQIPYEDCIVYRAHVRGFTMHPGSGVRGKGTFGGIIEKIPYLKELGITTLELLPTAEFAEVVMPERAAGGPYREPEPTGKINYWGYTTAYAYAPKASYAGKNHDPALELKKLVKALHQAGIELVLEMYFDGRQSQTYVLNAVRYWVREYHIDGVHLTGDAPVHLLARDPYLADTKMWATYWDGEQAAPGQPKRLAEYNDGFRDGMRRVLKGDEDQVRTLAECTKRNPAGYAVMNYMATTNGFTLTDLVTYEQKHNEANGENNRDGSDYNYSWNCGVEGPSRKTAILRLRRRQIRNALLLLFLSQGTPVLMAGDEFGNTQNGNNNAYCQDNETSWLNWKLLKTNQELFAFTKAVIAFRKHHPVLHQKKEPMRMDYLACGYPDMSFHGACAWVPEYEAYRRQLGIYYCGDYGKRADGTTDQYLYAAYNMHGDAYTLALPKLPKQLSWHIVVDSGDTEHGGIYEPGAEPETANQREIAVEPHTVLVLVGKEDPRKQEVKMPSSKVSIKKKETQENAKKP